MSQQYNESEFEKFESKVNNVMQILEDMNNPDIAIQEKGMENANKLLGYGDGVGIEMDYDETNFFVKVRENRTIINKSLPSSYEDVQEMEKFTFMQQIEQDAKQRAEVRMEREKIAENFRNLGNRAFRRGEYEKAISMYNKAIDHIKDSPILYNNRALSYIKIQMYKRAIIDCDYVINKLDEKNLRSWLYRAAAYYHMEDENNFESSVKMVKKNNSKEIEYIEKFLENLKK